MARWSAFYLAFLLALIFAALGVYYLIPTVYHPFAGDTPDQTYLHLKDAAVYLTLAALAVIAGRFTRPPTKE
jgi:hypothetical protein